MKTFVKISAFCFLIFVSTSAIAQDYATDKGAIIVSGTASFSLSSRSGSEDYYLLTLSPNLNYFVIPHLFVGMGLDFKNASQSGDYESSIGIGPQFGYAFGKPESTTIPYLSIGAKYVNTSYNYTYPFSIEKGSTSGAELNLRSGIIFCVKEHIGITFEVGYTIKKMETMTTTLKTLGFGVGISGLLF